MLGLGEGALNRECRIMATGDEQNATRRIGRNSWCHTQRLDEKRFDDRVTEQTWELYLDVLYENRGYCPGNTMESGASGWFVGAQFSSDDGYDFDSMLTHSDILVELQQLGLNDKDSITLVFKSSSWYMPIRETLKQASLFVDEQLNMLGVQGDNDQLNECKKAYKADVMKSMLEAGMDGKALPDARRMNLAESLHKHSVGFQKAVHEKNIPLPPERLRQTARVITNGFMTIATVGLFCVASLVYHKCTGSRASLGEKAFPFFAKNRMQCVTAKVAKELLDKDADTHAVIPV